jgi:hypothetical protein
VQVWRGQDMLSHAHVAVKVATSLEGRSRLRAEAGVLSRLQHGNIQRALGWVELEDTAGIKSTALVFEDSPHGSLGDAMAGMSDFQRYCKLTLLRSLNNMVLNITPVTLADCTLLWLLSVWSTRLSSPLKSFSCFYTHSLEVDRLSF